MYTTAICQIDKTWLKGRLQECVINETTGEVVAITGEDSAMAKKIADLLNTEQDSSARIEKGIIYYGDD